MNLNICNIVSSILTGKQIQIGRMTYFFCKLPCSNQSHPHNLRASCTVLRNDFEKENISSTSSKKYQIKMIGAIIQNHNFWSLICTQNAIVPEIPLSELRSWTISR